jgi:hypothetical protein
MVKNIRETLRLSAARKVMVVVMLLVCVVVREMVMVMVGIRRLLVVEMVVVVVGLAPGQIGCISTPSICFPSICFVAIINAGNFALIRHSHSFYFSKHIKIQ